VLFVSLFDCIKEGSEVSKHLSVGLVAKNCSVKSLLNILLRKISTIAMQSRRKTFLSKKSKLTSQFPVSQNGLHKISLANLID